MEIDEEDSHIPDMFARIDVIQKEIDNIDFETSFEETDIEDKEPSVNKSKNETQDYYPPFKDEEHANEVSLNTLPSADSDDLSILYGQNNYEWSRKTPEFNRIIAIPRIPEGVGQAASVRSPLESWALFMTDEMLFKIVTHTNEQISHLNRNASAQKYDKCTDVQEIKAFIGLLYFMGLQGIRRLNVKRLWSSLVSPIYHITMPYERFLFLSKNIRFEDINIRSTFNSTDKLAPIRVLWEQLIFNCLEYYIPSETCTIDVQSLYLNRPHSFRIHDVDDSDKVEIIMLNDSETFYLYNALPVIEVPILDEETIESHYMRVLCAPLYGSFRNIICDNYFTSVTIADRMENEYNLTVTGTIKKDQSEIPICMTRAGAKGTSIFAYNGNKILVSFCPRENKIVLLLSSFHDFDKIYSRIDITQIDIPEIIDYSNAFDKISSNMNIPEIIEYHNDFKDATEIFSQMCELYTTARYTQCWSSRFFYVMLDISGINSYILYQLNRNNISKSRYIFLEEVAYELIKPLLCEKLCKIAIKNEHYIIKNVLNNFTVGSQQGESIDYKLNNLVRCNICEGEKCRETQYICLMCKEPRCKEHQSMLCVNCAPSKV